MTRSDIDTRPHVYLTPLPVRGRPGSTGLQARPLINLGFNELPYGPTPRVAEALAQTALQVGRYGAPTTDAVRAAIGTVFDRDPDRLICGNGSEELLDVIARNFVAPGDEILISQFGYIQFALTANRLGARLRKAAETGFTTDIDALLAAVSKDTRLVFLANPNNPTGTAVPARELERLMEGLPGHVALVLDLAYGEFMGELYCADVHTLAARYDNVIVTRTFSKAFGLAGVRVGWAEAPEWMLPGFYTARGMGSVNAMAQAAAVSAVLDIAIIRDRVAEIVAERERVVVALDALGVETIPSSANFLMATIRNGTEDDTEALVQELLDEAGIIVNRTREAGLERFFRFSLSLPEHNDLLLGTIARFLAAR